MERFMNEEIYAFPHQYKSSPEELIVCFGMTLRDYFAAKAMQSLVQKYSHEGDVSRNAYKIADAMLEASK